MLFAPEVAYPTFKITRSQTIPCRHPPILLVLHVPLCHQYASAQQPCHPNQPVQNTVLLSHMTFIFPSKIKLPDDLERRAEKLCHICMARVSYKYTLAYLSFISWLFICLSTTHHLKVMSL